jgi:hypothetical protein
VRLIIISDALWRWGLDKHICVAKSSRLQTVIITLREISAITNDF